MSRGTLEPKKSSAKSWTSLVLAALFFTIIWSITGHAVGIFNMPWWAIIVILVMQGLIDFIWNSPKSTVSVDSSGTESAPTASKGPQGFFIQEPQAIKMKLQISSKWLPAVHPNGIYSFWHPAEWERVKPQSDASFFALRSVRIFLEVIVLGTGADPTGASKVGEILRTSLTDAHPDCRIIRAGPYQQETIDDNEALSQRRAMDRSGEIDFVTKMKPSTSGYRMIAEKYRDRLIHPKNAVADTITDYFSLHRDDFVLQLNFKTLSSDHARYVREFETVAASAKLGFLRG
jgi:hypothetical protein